MEEIQNKELDEIYSDYDEEDDAIEQLNEQTELEIAYTKSMNQLRKLKESERPTNKSLFMNEIIVPNCTFTSYLNPHSLIQIMEDKKLVNRNGDDLLLIKSKIDSFNPKEIDFDSKYSDISNLQLVFDRILYWIRNNPTLYSTIINFHTFSHQLTPFTEIKRQLSEEEVFQQFTSSDLIRISDDYKESIEYTFKMEDLLKFHNLLDHQEKKESAWRSLLVMIIFSILILPYIFVKLV